MSNFLSYQTALIAAGATQAAIQTAIDAKLTAQGWQRITYDTTNFISDFIPPSGETIGDGRWRQVTRLYYNTADISISMYDQPIADACAQMYRLYAKTAGAVAAGVTINGVTVNGAAGSAGSTANQNLYALWVALMQSADSNITNWKITYMPGIGGVDSILLERRTISLTVITITPNANVNGTAQGDAITAAGGATAQGIGAALLGKYAVIIDRTNGFYVYMDIFSRSFKIAIKTISNYYGPMFAYYAPNADALAMVPQSPAWALNPTCHISEGIYGLVNGTAAAPSVTYNCRTPNAFSISASWGYQATTPYVNGPFNWNADGGYIIPGIFQTLTANGHYSSGVDTFVASPVGIQASVSFNTSIDLFNIALGALPYAPQNIPAEATGPAAFLEDIFVSTNTDGNEVTCLAGLQTPVGITLAANLDDTTAYTTITLNSTTGTDGKTLAASGFVVLGQEVFQYTGTSGGNTLTGVTRAYNATPQVRHFIGDPVAQGGWFVKINGGYIYAGIPRPS